MKKKKTANEKKNTKQHITRKQNIERITPWMVMYNVLIISIEFLVMVMHFGATHRITSVYGQLEIAISAPN